MTILNSPNENDSAITKTLTLLPPDYTNERLDNNLAYFKIHHPSLYNAVVNYKCQEYRLCSNPDGSPNILEMKNKTTLYPSFTIDEILEAVHKHIDNLHPTTRINHHFLCDDDKRWHTNNNIQSRMLTNLYKAGKFGDLDLAPDFMTPLQDYKTDYIPLIRVNGIGLGFHLTELIKKKKISFMTIYEPHVDLFFSSLYTIPWQLIFKYFDSKGKGINLIVGGTPDEAIKNNIAFIKKRLLPLTNHFYYFNCFNSEKIAEVIAKEPQSDSVESDNTDAGWYEDQRAGFYWGTRNIIKRNRFFSGRKANSYFRAFVVGSGPSLDDTISYIKTHQNDALIVSCGSAITPLINAGIIPDYEVVQERFWHVSKFEEEHDLKILKKVVLLKLNVLSPKNDKFYKKALVFQKFKDPGSSLLDDNYPLTTAVNPTVTNAGISMCAALGVNEAYLFGVDYGAPQDSKTMHASNTTYDNLPIDDTVKSKTNLDLPGNLGSVIRSSSVLFWSLKTTEMKIAEYPDIKWYNVGDGALITGAAPVKLEELPRKFKKRINKKQLQEEISNCFNNHYSPSEVLERLRTAKMQQVEEYFLALRGFTDATPQTREEIINVLSLLYNAVNLGQNNSNFLPSSLLSYGFKQFITNVYIQSSLEENDNSATRFFEAAKRILMDYITDIEKDLTEMLNYIESDSEIDLLKC